MPAAVAPALLMLTTLGLAVALGGCPPKGRAGPGETTGPPGDDDDDAPEPCPTAPAAGSAIEELGRISRTVREARANLMVRASAAARLQPLYATLHHPQLWLLEAILAEPKKARAAAPAWLRRNLLRTFVELRATGARPLPIAPVFDRATLVDQRGRQYRPLFLARRLDDRGAVYRLAFETPPWTASLVPRRLTLRIPLLPRPVGPGGQIEAQWALSVRELPSFDRLPIAAGLAPARALRLARRALLLGQVGRARELVDEAGRCPGPWQKAAEQLTLVLVTEEAKRLEDAGREGAGAVSEQGVAASDDPASDDPVKLRRALLARLAPLSRLGVLDSSQLAAARLLLQRAQRSRSKAPDPRLAGGRQLVAFDQALAALLADALDPRSPVATARHPSGVRSRVIGAPPASLVPPALVLEDLRRRIERANAGLTPRYVGRTGRPGGRCGSRLCLVVAGREQGGMLPRLVARSGAMKVVATVRSRLGDGWTHPGLPVGLKLKVERFDDSASYWAGEVGRAHGRRALAALARRLLRHEVTAGDSPRATALAVAGMVQLDGKRALKLVRQVIEGGGPARSAAALRGLYALRQADGDARAIARRYVRGGPAERRAAAVTVLGFGKRGPASELRAALGDADPRVATATLIALLRRGQGAGHARRWLARGDSWQRQAVLASLARFPRPVLPLVAPLLAELRGEDIPVAVIKAMRAVPARRAAAPLLRLYQRQAALRRAVLEVSLAGPPDRAWLKLWQQARTEKVPVLRQLAVRGLARLARPPRLALEQAVADSDASVRLAAHVGLARLGQSRSLLALGSGARGTCEQRALVLEPICRALDAGSRARLLVDVLHSECGAVVLELGWRLAVTHKPLDESLLRMGLGHPLRWLRVAAAVAALGGRAGAALGVLPWK